MRETLRYHPQGAMVPGNPTYITREADTELEEYLADNEYCLILAPRQIGKSSLLARTIEAEKRNGRFTTLASLQFTNPKATPEKWFDSVIQLLAQDATGNDGFRLPFEMAAWLNANAEREPAMRLMQFLREGLLGGTEKRWLVALDEIDSISQSGFRDVFFSTIRQCYDLRIGNDRAFSRLTFILSGSATPGELVSSHTRTPFNIGRRIEMKDFSRDDIRPLAQGLPLTPETAQRVLERVYHWTDGQPHLTQDLCDALFRLWRRTPPPDELAAPATVVDAQVASRYFDAETRPPESHLGYMETRIRQHPRKTKILAVYRSALKSPLRDSRRSQEVSELKITGLLKADETGQLQVRNRIYGHVFDAAWVGREMPGDVWKTTALGTGTAFAMAATVWFLWLGPARDAEQRAEGEIRGLVVEIQRAENDVPRQAYMELKALPGRSELAEAEWDAYWVRQRAQLVSLADKLANPKSIDEVWETEHATQLMEVAKRLEQDSASEEATRAAELLVKALTTPLDTQRPEMAEAIIAQSSAMAKALGRLAPLWDEKTGTEVIDDLLKALEKGEIAETDRRFSQSQQQSGKVIPDWHDGSERVTAIIEALEGVLTQMKTAWVSGEAQRLAGMLDDGSQTVAADLVALGHLLSVAAGRLDEANREEAKRIALRPSERLAEAARTQTDFPQVLALANALIDLVNFLDRDQAENLVGPVIVRIVQDAEDKKASFDEFAFSRCLRRLIPYANASIAEDTARRLMRLYDGGALTVSVVWLAAAMADVEGSDLEPVAEWLTAKIEVSTGADGNAELVLDLGTALAALTGKMSDRSVVADLHTRATMAIVAMLEQPENQLWSVDPFTAFAAGLPEEEATEAAGRVLAAMENPTMVDGRALAPMGMLLAALVVETGDAVAPDLARRGAAILIKDLNSAERITRYSRPEALSALAKSVAQQDRVPLATELYHAMEALESGDRAIEMGAALASLLAGAESIHGTPLATRTAAILAERIEKAEVNAPGSWSDFETALLPLIRLMPPEDAAMLANRLLATLNQSPQPDLERLTALGMVMLVAVDRSPDKTTHVLAATAAKGLSEALTMAIPDSDAEDALIARSLIFMLAPWMEPAKATELAARHVTAFDLGAKDEEISDDLFLLHGMIAASMAVRAPVQEATRASEAAMACLDRAFTAAEDEPLDDEDRTSIENEVNDLLIECDEFFGPSVSATSIAEWVSSLEKLQARFPENRERLEELIETLRMRNPDTEHR